MNSVLGIFGGTFDPIHCGHLEVARELRDALGFSAVRFIPAGDPPHRAAPVATPAHRLAMVELAVEGQSGLEVDAREIHRPERSYTVPTLEELWEEDRSRTLALILGADAFLGLPTWHRWRDVFALAHLVIVPRPGVPLEAALPAVLADEWTQRLSADARVLTATPAGAIVLFCSSTTDASGKGSGSRAASAIDSPPSPHACGTRTMPAPNSRPHAWHS